MNIRSVTIIGANGTMGSNVAGIFASFGQARVFLISRDMEKSYAAAMKAAKSVRADSIIQRLVPADYSQLEECVRQSDLVFESVAEDMAIKQQIMGRVSVSLRDDAVFATGTSGLSISQLSESLPPHQRGRFFGVHMFNPPYNLTLCELIAGKHSDPELKEMLKSYLRDKLLRTVIEVKDAPAFLGNRIGFQFLNRALQYAEQYRDSGGIDYVDAILGPFTGRMMAPIATVDFVGLDVHKAIVDNVLQNVNDYAKADFVLPEYCQTLIDAGRLGRKRREGLYKLVISEDGSRALMVYDILTGAYRQRSGYELAFVDQVVAYMSVGAYARAARTIVDDETVEGRLCLSMMLDYIAYSLFAARQVGQSAHDADSAMATGYNWCPPLALYEFLSLAGNVDTLMEERLAPGAYAVVARDALLGDIEKSRYDFRPFLKAKR